MGLFVGSEHELTERRVRWKCSSGWISGLDHHILKIRMQGSIFGDLGFSLEYGTVCVSSQPSRLGLYMLSRDAIIAWCGCSGHHYGGHITWCRLQKSCMGFWIWMNLGYVSFCASYLPRSSARCFAIEAIIYFIFLIPLGSLIFQDINSSKLICEDFTFGVVRRLKKTRAFFALFSVQK